MNKTVNQPSGALSERALLVTLRISKWTASKHDKQISKEVADKYSSKETMGHYRRNLLEGGALDEINSAANQARTEHNRLTVPWAEDAQRALATLGYLDYTEQMRKHQEKFWAAVDRFFPQYAAYKTAARAALNGQYHESDYPSEKELRRKFAFEIEVGSMPDPRDFRASLAQEEIAVIQKKIEQGAENRVQQAMGDIWARLTEVIGHFSESMKAYRVTPDGVENSFKDATVNNIGKLLDILPSLNIAGDPKVAQFAQVVQAELMQHSAATLRESETTRLEAAQRADEILNQISDFI